MGVWFITLCSWHSTNHCLLCFLWGVKIPTISRPIISWALSGLVITIVTNGCAKVKLCLTTLPYNDQPQEAKVSSQHWPNQAVLLKSPWPMGLPYIPGPFSSHSVKTALNQYQNALRWILQHDIDRRIRSRVNNVKRDWRKVSAFSIYPAQYWLDKAAFERCIRGAINAGTATLYKRECGACDHREY